jgi:hypothetical protein
MRQLVKFEIADFLDKEGREHIRPCPSTMLLQWQRASGMKFWPTITTQTRFILEES